MRKTNFKIQLAKQGGLSGMKEAWIFRGEKG